METHPQRPPVHTDPVPPASTPAPADIAPVSAVSSSSLPGWLVAALRLLITLAVLPFLLLTSVRLVMSEVFLQIEYHRPGFPDDRFGFTRDDRLTYAPYAIRYLLTGAGIETLGDLQLDGEALFTPEELRHMKDVKAVTRAAFAVHNGLILALGGAMLVLAWRPNTRRAIRQGLFEGALLTIFLIVTLVVLMLASWDFFFTGFHRVFFEGDSWQFSTRDTLIRLFPEQFWFDAAFTIGGLTLAGVGLILWGIWYWERRWLRRTLPEPAAARAPHLTERDLP